MLTALETDLSGRPIDLDRFWAAVDVLEHRPAHKLQKYNRFQALRLRYYDDGCIAHTYQEIAGFYGVHREYARAIVHQALRSLRHPRLASQYRSS